MTPIQIITKSTSNFIYRIVRLPPELKPYIPIIGTGLRLLISSWQFPSARPRGVRNTRVPLTLEDIESINFLLHQTKKSAAEIISAALRRAEQSKVRPPIMPVRKAPPVDTASD
jgi:hypothetical protein